MTRRGIFWKYCQVCIRKPFARLSYVAVFFLTGCAGIEPYGSYPGDTDTNKTYVAKYWTIEELTAYDKTADPAAKLALRNEIVEGRIASIDIFYREYISSLYKGEKQFDIGTDGAVLALSAIGTIGAPAFDAITLKIVSATSGLITGFKSKWDADVFYNQTLPILVKTMNQSRSTVLDDIRKVKEKDSSIPLVEILGEVDQYFEAGGLLTAINILGQTDVSQPTTTKPAVPSPAGAHGAALPAPASVPTQEEPKSPVQRYFNL